MKKYMNWALSELDSMYPFEFQLFYFMAVGEYKSEKGIK
jgi:hypothetical protein